jgi:hypothetical protein
MNKVNSFISELYNDKLNINECLSIMYIMLYVFSDGKNPEERLKLMEEREDIIIKHLPKEFFTDIKFGEYYRWYDYEGDKLDNFKNKIIIDRNRPSYSYSELRPDNLIKSINRDYGFVYRFIPTYGHGICVYKLLTYFKYNAHYIVDMLKDEVDMSSLIGWVLKEDLTVDTDKLHKYCDKFYYQKEVIIFSNQTRIINFNNVVKLLGN